MAFNGLRLEYALEGNSNKISWKDRMEAVLKDNGLKEFIDNDVPKPTLTDAALLDAWKKKVAKARRILLEGVQDQIVSSLHGKATPYAMSKDLKDLFQSNLTIVNWLSKINSRRSRWKRMTVFGYT